MKTKSVDSKIETRVCGGCQWYHKYTPLQRASNSGQGEGWCTIHRSVNYNKRNTRYDPRSKKDKCMYDLPSGRYDDLDVGDVVKIINNRPMTLSVVSISSGDITPPTLGLLG